MVIIQNRWSSASVMVLPGQCRYTSPGSKSSRKRPKGWSEVVTTPALRLVADELWPRGGPQHPVGVRLTVDGHAPCVAGTRRERRWAEGHGQGHVDGRAFRDTWRR